MVWLGGVEVALDSGDGKGRGHSTFHWGKCLCRAKLVWFGFMSTRDRKKKLKNALHAKAGKGRQRQAIAKWMQQELTDNKSQTQAGVS